MNNKPYTPADHKEEILKLEEKGLININKNHHRYWVLNYSKEAMIDYRWDEHLINCRGIVIDKSDWSVVARPFPKFFNHDEENNKYKISFDVEDPNVEFQEKLDGSLGIIFYDKINKKWIASTRGSLLSEQAIWATKYLDSSGLPFDMKYNLSDRLDINYTYLVEIIYPANRIIVDYADFSGLVLLGIIETQTGIEKDINDNVLHGNRLFHWAKKYSFDEMAKLYKDNADNLEGFVAVIKNPGGINHRVKIKLQHYLEKHRVKFSFTVDKLFHVKRYDTERYLKLLEYSKDNKEISNALEKWEVYFNNERAVLINNLNAQVSKINHYLVYFKLQNYDLVKNITKPYQIKQDDDLGKWVNFLCELTNIEPKYRQYIYHRILGRGLKSNYLDDLLDFGAIGKLPIIN